MMPWEPTAWMPVSRMKVPWPSGRAAGPGTQRRRAAAGKCRRAMGSAAGAAILEQPAAVVVLVEAEGRIALEHLTDYGRGVVRRSR